MQDRRFGAMIMLGVVVTLLVSAWNAHMPDVWLLENLVLLIVAPFIFMAWRNGCLSRSSVWLLFLFSASMKSARITLILTCLMMTGFAD